MSSQLRALFMFLGLGFLLGIVYDVERIIRLSVSRGRVAVYVADSLFAVTAAGVTFCFTLAVNYGEMHMFMLLAEITGFCVYYFTFDSFVRRVSDKAVKLLKKIYAFLFKIFSAPVKLVFFVLRKIGHAVGIPLKKFEKNLNLVLQKIKNLVYNKVGLLYRRNRKRKRASSDEKS